MRGLSRRAYDLRGRTAIASVVLGVAALAACTLTRNLGDLTGGTRDAGLDVATDSSIDASTDSSIDGASDAGSCDPTACGAGGCGALCVNAQCTNNGDCATGTCAADPDAGLICQCPVGMVTVPKATKDGFYCVDATEVTNDAYTAFVAAGTPPTALSECSTNSYLPAPWPPPNGGNFPVTGVTWCDAFAYCAWSNKHLCGAVGGGAVAFAGSAFFNAAVSEWFNACSGADVLTYPYATMSAPTLYDMNRCNGLDYQNQSPPPPPPFPTPPGVAPVGSTYPNGTCEGAFGGLLDMSGNVWEWENSCDPGTNVCRVRGGSFKEDPNGLKCEGVPLNSTGFSRGDTRAAVGFRCCGG